MSLSTLIRPATLSAWTLQTSRIYSRHGNITSIRGFQRSSIPSIREFSAKSRVEITSGLLGQSRSRPLSINSRKWQLRPTSLSSLGRRDLTINVTALKEDVLKPLSKAFLYFAAGFLLMMSGVAASSLPNLLAPIQADTFVPLTVSQEQVEEFINSHPTTLSLRENSDYHESRPHLIYPPAFRESSLTAGTLQGTGKLEVPPYMWISPEKKELVSIAYLGRDLCGHPGMIHGGLLATLLDEGLARCAFESLPSRICVTASLKVDYRSPVRAGSYVALKARTLKIEGRKCWVKGEIVELSEEGETGRVIAEAEALMIEPRSKVMGMLGKNLSRAMSAKHERA